MRKKSEQGSSVCVCECARARACVCVCVCRIIPCEERLVCVRKRMSYMYAEMAYFPNYKIWKFSQLHIVGIQGFFVIWKVIKIPNISKFWNCSSIRYFAPFAIWPIFILPFDINFIFYYSDSREFSLSTIECSLIFKFEISAILKFYCSKF